jgi:predicted component of type VI protein secretion system
MVQDLASFKGGDRLYINLSNTQIRIQLGDTLVNVAPKKTKIYESPVLNKPTNVSIMYQFYHPEHEKWRMISASTVVIRPTRRKICVFNEGTRIGNIKKHNILFPVQKKEPQD